VGPYPAAHYYNSLHENLNWTHALQACTSINFTSPNKNSQARKKIQKVQHCLIIQNTKSSTLFNHFPTTVFHNVRYNIVHSSLPSSRSTSISVISSSSSSSLDKSESKSCSLTSTDTPSATSMASSPVTTPAASSLCTQMKHTILD
jgi:hypothetical protein